MLNSLNIASAVLVLTDYPEAPGNISLQFPTRCVHNLAIDWLDENYIASCQTSKDATICVWDRRVGYRYTSPSLGPVSLDQSQSGAALELNNIIDSKATIWSMRFSRTKRGCLGVLSNTGHFKTYDIAKEYISDEYRSSMDETLGPGSLKNYPEQIYTKYVRDLCKPYNHPSRGCNESERVVSFDWLNMSASNRPSSITLAGNGQVAIANVLPPSPPVQLSSQSMLVRGCSDGISDFEVMHPLSGRDSKISEVVESIQRRSLSGSANQQDGLEGHSPKKNGHVSHSLSSRETRERALSIGTLGDRLRAEEALTLMTVNRFRCKEGYLFDGAKNKQIVADDPSLQGFWDWMESRLWYLCPHYSDYTDSSGSRVNSADDSMIMNDLDMNYLGIIDVWNNDLGENLDLCPPLHSD